MELEPQSGPEPVAMARSCRMTPRNTAVTVVKGKILQRVLAVSFGLVCVLQALLNVSLRLLVRGEVEAETVDICTSCVNQTNRMKLSTFDDYFQQGWVYLHPSLYYVSPDKKSWSESRQDCLQRQSDLLILSNDLEQEFLGKFQRTIWMGLTDTEEEGTWKWVDGTTLTKSYWDNGEPNSYGGHDEDCVEMKGPKQPNAWNDADCQTRNFWVCEKMVTL
ncbi:CD209 antigen-like protein C isoform X1 [Nelusetta ayraudi]|uniref:CD209 antigen-like protein C isoform X1 n=1 Tax=Nelusetta ayraudi TaxID=303726 RepID=UPI003F6F1777